MLGFIMVVRKEVFIAYCNALVCNDVANCYYYYKSVEIQISLYRMTSFCGITYFYLFQAV